VPHEGKDASLYLSSMEEELYNRTGTRANFLAGYDLDALAIDAHGEDLGASFVDGLFHALAGVWFNQRTTQPPPPAPHTFPASAPLRRAFSITRSMVFVEIVGKFRLRKDHSSRIRRPASSQSGFSSATRISWATSEMRSRLFWTALFPPICALKTSNC